MKNTVSIPEQAASFVATPTITRHGLNTDAFWTQPQRSADPLLTDGEADETQDEAWPPAGWTICRACNGHGSTAGLSAYKNLGCGLCGGEGVLLETSDEAAHYGQPEPTLSYED